jgi:hypothetical protein
LFLGISIPQGHIPINLCVFLACAALSGPAPGQAPVTTIKEKRFTEIPRPSQHDFLIHHRNPGLAQRKEIPENRAGYSRNGQYGTLKTLLDGWMNLARPENAPNLPLDIFPCFSVLVHWGIPYPGRISHAFCRFTRWRYSFIVLRAKVK